MFKQAKSAFIWYQLYKFRKTVVSIVLLLCIVFFSQWIYSDVVEYLTLRKKLEYLDILLPIKWAVIFFNIGLSTYLVTSLFKKEKKQEIKKEKVTVKSSKKETVEKEEIKEQKKSKETLSQREASFLHSKKLNNKADSLINR